MNDRARPTITIDERDRKDYFAPPSDLFQDYCAWIAERYGLCDEELIQKASVSEIDYDFIPQFSPTEKLFVVRTDTSTLYARSVVLAVGAGNAPSIPKPFPRSGCPCASHAFQPLDEALEARVRARKPTNVMVIGGGLTSAQVADRALRKGAGRVYHLMRGPMKGEEKHHTGFMKAVVNSQAVKPFDVDLSWMGKFRNHEKASFWSADSDEGQFPEMISAALPILMIVSRTLGPCQIRPRRRQHHTTLRQNPRPTHPHRQTLHPHTHKRHALHLQSSRTNLDNRNRKPNPRPTQDPLRLLRHRRPERFREVAVPTEDRGEVSPRVV